MEQKKEQGETRVNEPETIVQSLTMDQIEYVARKVGITENSVVQLIDHMNKNDFIALGLVEMTPDVVIGFSLCEQQQAGEI